MKKIVGHALLTVILILALVPQARSQVMNAITATALQGKTWSFKVVQNFVGINLTATTAAPPTNGIRLDGDTSSIDTYKAGSLQKQIRSGYEITPTCPDSETAIELGALCKKVSAGLVCVRDSAGLFNVRGGGPCQ